MSLYNFTRSKWCCLRRTIIRFHIDIVGLVKYSVSIRVYGVTNNGYCKVSRRAFAVVGKILVIKYIGNDFTSF